MADSATAERAPATTVTRGVNTANPRSAASGTGDTKGALVIADRVGAKIARRAALEVDGVIRSSSAIGSLLGPGPLGSAYPSVRVDMADAAPIVEVRVALRWPCAVGEVSRTVSRHVAHELARLTGIRPSRVNVEVAVITSEREESASRDGYVELPAPPVIAARGGGSDDDLRAADTEVASESTAAARVLAREGGDHHDNV